MRYSATAGSACILIGALAAVLTGQSVGANTGVSASAMLLQRAATGDSQSVALWEGIDAMYSYRFHQSETALEAALALDSLEAVVPFVAVANQWLMSLTEHGYRASHEAMLQAIDATIPMYESMLSSEGRRPEILLYLGSTYGLKTRVHLADKSWLAGLYAGIKGWRMIRKAYAADTTLADAYLPIGVFSYYAGLQSRPVQLVARIFGLQPDREVGLRILRRAVEEAPHAWIEAASTLAIIYLYLENDPHAAFPYTQLIVVRYPGNYYFNFLFAEALVRNGRLKEAREFLPALKSLFMTSHPTQRIEWTLKYASLEAALSFQAGDLDTALERCQWVIDNYDMEFDWHLGFAHNIRGQIRESRGDLDGARDDYRIVAGLGNRTFVTAEARAALQRLRMN